jgi:hypothetical protein
MEEFIDKVNRILADVLVPCLRTVQATQCQQIAANSRMEQTIHELRGSLEAQFAEISMQLTACRAELAATQAVLHAAQMQHGIHLKDQATLIH